MKRKFVKKDLNVYREKLLSLKDSLLEQMKDIADTTLMKTQKDISGDMSGYSLHIADVATDNYEREFNLGIVSDEREIILEIEDAVKRIEEKKYGDCLSCKKPIAKIRLNAIPYAKYCKKCKEQLEKEAKV